MKHPLAVFVGFLLMVSPALAQRGPAMQDRGPAIHEKLNLTEEQQQKFDALRSDQQKAMIDNRAKVAKARVEMRDLMAAEKLDKSAIQKKQSEIAGLEADMQTKRLDHWFAVNSILTPEQQKIWKKGLMNAGPRGERQGMRGPRGMRHRGMMGGPEGMMEGPGNGMQQRERMHK